MANTEFETEAQELSYRLQEAARALDFASEMAEFIGWPSLARDLAVAMVTVQRARSEFNRTSDQTSQAIKARFGGI